MKSILFLLLITILFTSCGPAVTFQQPQPADVDSLLSFPARLQGKYISSDKASVLNISGDLIYRVYDYELKIHKDSLAETIKEAGDSLADSTRETIVRQEGDSILTRIHFTDTLFHISDMQVLKKFKGFYFLNDCQGPASWTVQKMGLSRGVLTVAGISAYQDINDLRNLTETPNDTLSYHFSLTKKQFRQFLRNDGFRSEERFYRIK